MLIIYILIAAFIAWIWVDYYRLIDIYEKESLKYFILTFILGCASVLIVMGIHEIFLDHIPFGLNGSFLNDFLYCILGIGLVEEIAKATPFFVVYFFFKEQINDPIDYLAFISVSALGFSAAENVLYFNTHGPYIINNRAILCSVGHMFDSSLLAYGLIRYKYYYKRHSPAGVFLFLLLASLAHGFYDFWLLHEGTKSGGWIITILYFFITISIFATILNNALNHSSHFTYKKVVDPNKISKKILNYYGIVFLIQFILLTNLEGLGYAILNFKASVLTTGFIITITVVRLSRFKLIKNRWEKIKIELPFTFNDSDTHEGKRTFYHIRIKGESFSEAHISTYFEEFFWLHPVSSRNSYIGVPRVTFIEQKIFLKNDESFFVAKIFIDDKKEKYELVLLKPKKYETTMFNKKYPIVAILKIEDIKDIENVSLAARNFKFREWAFIKPQQLSA